MTQTVNDTNPEIGRSIKAAGISTNYHDWGVGAPVLLVHGSGPGVSAWANWRGVLPPLSADRRLIAPDVVGFGYSERPPGFEFSPQAWVDHLVGFLDAVGLPSVSAVGNSFGGALALQLADRYPDRIDRLVLMGSAGTRFELTPGLDAVGVPTASIRTLNEPPTTGCCGTSAADDDSAGHTSSTEEWDDYEWAWTGSLTEWALQEARAGENEVDATQALAVAAEHRTAWLRGYRHELGFVTLVLADAQPRPVTAK